MIRVDIFRHKIAPLILPNQPYGQDPIGAVNNQRSLVYIDSLVNMIVTCCEHPNDLGEIFLVSDGYNVTTTKLLKAVAHHMQSPSLLVPIITNLMSKQAIAQRIFGSLQLD